MKKIEQEENITRYRVDKVSEKGEKEKKVRYKNEWERESGKKRRGG